MADNKNISINEILFRTLEWALQRGINVRYESYNKNLVSEVARYMDKPIYRHLIIIPRYTSKPLKKTFHVYSRKNNK